MVGLEVPLLDLMNPAVGMDWLSRLVHLRARFVGYVDRAETDALVGWAADLVAPERRVVVEVTYDGRVVA